MAGWGEGGLKNLLLPDMFPFCGRIKTELSFTFTSQGSFSNPYTQSLISIGELKVDLIVRVHPGHFWLGTKLSCLSRSLRK